MISSPRARIGVLAGIVFVGIGIALAVTLHSRHGAAKQPGTPWYSALAAPYASARGSAKTECGTVIGPSTIGVGHPILPCGAKLEVEFGGKDVFTRVIDRVSTVPGHTFDLTPALARELGVQGTQTIRWRFAP